MIVVATVIALLAEATTEETAVIVVATEVVIATEVATVTVRATLEIAITVSSQVIELQTVQNSQLDHLAAQSSATTVIRKATLLVTALQATTETAMTAISVLVRLKKLTMVVTRRTGSMASLLATSRAPMAAVSRLRLASHNLLRSSSRWKNGTLVKAPLMAGSQTSLREISLTHSERKGIKARKVNA